MYQHNPMTEQVTKNTCLGLREPVVDDIHETVCLHRIPHNRGEPNAALHSARLREINYGKVCPVDCRGIRIAKSMNNANQRQRECAH